MRKVIIFINSLTGGGAERVTAALAGYLAGRDYDVTVVTMHGVEADFYAVAPRVKRVALKMAGRTAGAGKIIANLGRMYALRRVVRREQARTVIGMMTTPAVLAILASAGLPARFPLFFESHLLSLI